ncbi:hypothetical protein [Streptomyces lasiicapitis]|uniref:Helix-turn-helix domain-containing protein n=1 Tax=Streptomyces lasiicapitis TaxID=1923961 RepID=A0ABQ2M5W9_9ACTN|nr:hypothetical protein [Streptomyces lasiicapitis]GGO47100.1 hypothetical protein GCM10012286_39570 [Streptomyces lasiicapitis]
MDLESIGMLRHAIAPARRYTKASHDVVRHPCLNSDAKILLLYVQGLPDADASAKSLSEHAARLGITGRAYQRAKQLLADSGYLHEWRWQGERGRWITEQLLANVTLTREGAGVVREGGCPEPLGPSVPPVSPSAQPRTVGRPRGREVGGSYPDKNVGEDLSHLPPELDPEPGSKPAPEVAEAERVLLSLRHVSRELLLGVREARGLADAAAEWLRRGVSAAELRLALTAGLPVEGVRSAAGFVRHRLVQKLPAVAEVVPVAGAGVGAEALVTCEGPGDEHVFRRVGEERECGRCRVAAAVAAGREGVVRGVPWRERVAGVTAGAAGAVG